MSQEVFDYIVVGGGSAGCIVASRLANHGNLKVLLLEAGQAADRNPETLNADGFRDAFANDAVIIDRASTAQDNCGNRSLFAGSGRGMGGSGAVNGMVYTRGDKLDFAQWPKGWHWQDVEPTFIKLEETLRPRSRAGSPFTELFIHSSAALGFSREQDLNNGSINNKIGYNAMNFEGDKRRSSYVAFIRDEPPQNLTVKTDAHVHKLCLRRDNDNRHVVTSVRYRHQGAMHEASVKREVIMCAGALETPKLLMLSGIGPRNELEPVGITVDVESDGVGQNLHDHPNVCMFYRAKNPIDFGYPQLYGFNRANPRTQLASGQADTCYVLFSAPLTLHKSMLRMAPVLALPGRLYKIKTLRSLLRGAINLAFKLAAVRSYVEKIYGIVVILGKPESRGSIGLLSADPEQQARIDPAYYSERRDMDTLLAGVATAKKIAEQAGMAAWGNKAMSLGGKSDDKTRVRKWAEAATMTTFHYCGSCAMGETDKQPVDLELRLKGVANIRVADASAIPEIPVSAINAPTMMIAYRAADFILAGHSL
ncbi:GMC family oxidoreductase [uncultured Zhongshania sp.]|uniref:GMC family oxidoreductase n=1 Tax=uncultured Zhongshania sp. TaxID=1642288 RepID=UPI0030DD02D2